MTALPLQPPRRLLTVADFAAFHEANEGRRDELARRRREGGLLRADEVVLAVEIVSDGSQRTDRSIKHAEYADAGIPHYWILDVEDKPALIACHRAGEFGFADAPPVTGTFSTEQPFPVTLDLDALA